MNFCRWCLWLIVGAAVSVWAGCSTENPLSMSSAHPGGSAWLDKKSSQFHGGSSLNCAQCHSVPTDCNQCHFGAGGQRSPDGWAHGLNTVHHNYTDQAAVCNTCHDLNRGYGNAPDSCHDCHGSGAATHVTGQAWLDKKSSQFHGGSSLNCAQCHSVPAECTECHFGAGGQRSPDGWTHGLNTAHHNYTNQATVCNACHDLNRRYGNAPDNCHDCHGSGAATHVTGQAWLDKKSSQFHGNSSLDCAQCHSMPADCTECHFGANGQRSPDGWTHGFTGHRSYSNQAAVCTTCHNLNRSYGNAPGSCHDCHGDGDDDDDDD